uniref:FTH domain-containing protein n=1 Tax=Steinernema glaseri TaxID=37863 RepID=A0A1I7ZAP5_9BILA
METVLLEHVNQLVAGTKAQKALCGGLLPLNNNPSILQIAEISTVTVVDTDGVTPVAFGAFNRYSMNQAYCMLNELDDKYRKNFVKVERVEKEGADKRNVTLKISTVLGERTNLGGLPQYFNAFAERTACPLLQHVVDELLANTVGTGNMDVRKNITVDLYDGMNPQYNTYDDDLWRDFSGFVYNTYDDDLWRDFSGFVVSDRYRYFELELPKEKLVETVAKQEKSGATLRFESLNKKSEPFFGDYDSTIAIAHRQEFLEFFTALPGVQGTIAFDEASDPVGYVLSLNDRILQSYAETPQLCNEILNKHLESMDAESVKMFVRYDSEWVTEELLASATTTNRVRRFHTRTMPAQVKWPKVFIMNTGLHLF